MVPDTTKGLFAFGVVVALFALSVWAGLAAIGIAAAGRKFAYASSEGTELYDVDAIFEARARRLPQGDYEIGISVPGRVSKQPYWQGLIVKRRRDAERWAETVKPHLGARLKVDGLG